MAYSQLQKVEASVHINASAEQYHDLLCNKTHQIPNIIPQKIQSVQILKGEWGTEGSIISWNYLHDGKISVAKDLVEGIDKKNNKMNLKVLEGDVLGHYKSAKFIVQATPKENGSIVNWVLEYEKKNDQNPNPYSLLEIATEMTKEMGAYLAKK